MTPAPAVLLCPDHGHGLLDVLPRPRPLALGRVMAGRTITVTPFKYALFQRIGLKCPKCVSPSFTLGALVVSHLVIQQETLWFRGRVRRSRCERVPLRRLRGCA